MKKTLFLQILFITIITIFGFFLRIYDINWDQGTHIHPDERFLTMVGTAMQTPISFFDYLTPSISKMNPENINFGFFVYGVFPIIFTKIYAIIFHVDTYQQFNLLGRFFSALADSLVIIFLFRLGRLLEKKYNLPKTFSFLSSFLYAIAVLPMQSAHFFTVDTFLNSFSFIAVFLAVDFWDKKRNISFFFSAIFLGLATSSKITSILSVPLIFLFLFLGTLSKSHNHISFKRILKTPVIPFLLSFIIYSLIFYVSVRLSNPYYFQTSNFLNPTINTTFINNIHTLSGYNTPTAWYPPGVQWIHKTPIIYGLFNIIMYGIGFPYALLALLGIFYIVLFFRKTIFVPLLIWIIGTFLYLGVQYVQVMRYFLILYPYLALLAALGISLIAQRRWLIIVFILLIIGTWPASFFSIYTKPHSRVTASMWIYQTVPSGKQMLGELWDDPLPLSVTNTYEKIFPPALLLPVFDPDTPEKWAIIYRDLNKGDYLILSSNRGWGSIPTASERFPLMTKFYHDLFAEKFSYKKIKEFTSYPSLSYLGIPLTFPDESADESFTVYDHPKIMIFQKK